jgi:A/G-specific adenine glycosylase
MLQQTQVAAVIGYFERFMARFPDVQSLADAPADEVLHLWTGLGYYARARNLQACAKILAAEHGGDFPARLDAVMALPGIGRSTAGAILALARGERHPILDGNVKRVLARVFGIDGDRNATATVSRFWDTAEGCTPAAAAVAAYTQAIMDLGATVCTPKRPACTLCPMHPGCIAAAQGRQAELPGRAAKARRGAREATLLVALRNADGGMSVLVERRPPSGIWGGLWSPPQFASPSAALDWCRREVGEIEPGAEPALATIEHAFTHFDLRLHPLRVRCRPHDRVAESAAAIGAERRWYPLRDPPRLGLPQPMVALFARLLTQ